ncbi:MAG: nicotinate (nicotinamide) nucleotide adenylyltransferase, partial [Clostridia bacterium]|nr:nicotinate (nicotinamide) nucleotide adenylyltransferase [Clostridia bacterium]
MKIGIFGGTFDPVHNEHVNTVKTAIKELGLDRLYVIPAYVSPFKRGVTVTSPADRMEMVRLAFKDAGEKVIVSDYEIEKGGSSYTYETVLYLKKFFPHDNLYLIVGGDSLSTFRTWCKPEVIMKNADLAVVDRNFNYTALETERKKFRHAFGKEFIKLEYVGS